LRRAGTPIGLFFAVCEVRKGGLRSINPEEEAP
jgi:hypothetical protein